ncbi:PSD1 and planctomycete cytochrome C domain-containing protein [bacterium]|nr:PSD1 and planctomycete cytochrome C domain-containing protein [bacterium]
MMKLFRHQFEDTVSRGLFFACSLLCCFGMRADIDEEALAFFEKEVRPVLIEHCYECHSAGSKKLKGGLLLDSAKGVQDGGDSGPVIVLGAPDSSPLLEAVRYLNRDLQMPPNGKLSEPQIEALEKWIRIGTPDPREQVSGKAIKPLGMSVEDGRNFWAFKPVRVSSIPVSHLQSERTENPIDVFHQAALTGSGISPASQADKRTLIRRASYGLIGLPPTRAEVESFVADDSPEAFEFVIERLLKSPQYGVRWGRHWMDVARYADSNGRDENLAFGNAWRYRDYVIDSFNRDKPFDQFLVEQIAGDLMPDSNQETKIATGFLQLGAKVLAEGDMEKLIMDTVDEQIDTVGQAFLGLTLGCARCHTHKFDPIMQDDYYALAAIFKGGELFNEKKMGAIKYWYEHSFASEEEKKNVEEADKEIKRLKSIAASFKSKEMVKLRGQARDKAVDYLVAASMFDVDSTLEEVGEIAMEMELHPRILYHCRQHLDFHKSDSFFRTWHENGNEPEAIRLHYRSLFDEANSAFLKARKEDPKLKILVDVRLEAARAALHDLAGFLAVPLNPANAFDPMILAEFRDLEEQARLYESTAAEITSAMGVRDGGILTELALHIRGSHLNLGKPIKRNFPEVMRQKNEVANFAVNQSGRLEFAEWMVDPRHPLTARVFVNRIWRWHFGRGIVGTTENFGIMGDRPTHPELLDWLAEEFVRAGWSVKHLHRLIMKSRAYRMSGKHPEAEVANAVDPGNQLWWRFDLRRLEAEEIRDSALAVAGMLDYQLGGKTIPLRNRQFVFNHTSEDHTGYLDKRRRSVYLPVVRNHLCDVFEQFDFPDPSLPNGNRQSTVVAPQALLLMNSPLFMDAASSLAETLLDATGDDAAQGVVFTYQHVFARDPTPVEATRALHFIKELTGPLLLLNSSTVDLVGMSSQRKVAWSLLCQSLFASNEFLYLN